jgi:hypothetical protein
MNDDVRLQSQLERATSREAGGSELDQETSELRAGWLALTRLLEAAHTEVDETSLLQVVVRAERRRKLQFIAVVGALAASLLLVLLGGWQLSHNLRGPDTAAPREVAVPNPPAPPKAQPDIARLQPDLPGDVALSWDDSLDDRLTQLTRNIVGFERPGMLEDSAFTVLGERVQQAGADVGEKL